MKSAVTINMVSAEECLITHIGMYVTEYCISSYFPQNPLNTRIIYAFLIFGKNRFTYTVYHFVYPIATIYLMLLFCHCLVDFDGDGHLGPGDLMEMLDFYTGKEEKLDDVHKERLVQEVCA